MLSPKEAFSARYAQSIQNPLQTLDGHINLEISTVHDYFGRAVLEFFQNAVDRADRRIWFHLDMENREMWIANDGQPFSVLDRQGRNYTDFESVCSINTSSKDPNESIGNKGVGFKSCWEYATRVSVYSKLPDGSPWGLRLHRRLTKKILEGFAGGHPDLVAWLQREDLAAVLERHDGCMPSFYFPEQLIEFSPPPAGMESAVTVIRFESIEAEKLPDLAKRLEEFARHPLFFVSQLPKLRHRDITVAVSRSDGMQRTLGTQEDPTAWKILSHEFSPAELDELTKLGGAHFSKIKQPRIAVAFPLRPVADSFEPLCCCYLPTRVKFGFGVTVHGDFQLDSARKQIDFEGNRYNAKLLEHLCRFFVHTLAANAELHDLPHFGSFLSCQGADPMVRDILKLLLFDGGTGLQALLKKVYRQDRPWGEDAYSALFAAIDSWLWDREPGSWNQTHSRSLYDRVLHHFCGEGIHIVPTVRPRAGETLSKTYLPRKEEGEKANLFFRAAKESADESADGALAEDKVATLLDSIPGVAISGFPALRNSRVAFAGLTSEYSARELARSLANIAKDQPVHRPRILEICLQFVRGEAAPSRADFFNIDRNGYQFARIPLPCRGGDWHPAGECYFGLGGEIAQDLDRCHELDLDELQKHSGAADPASFAIAMGSWRGVLPLTLKGELPWATIPSGRQVDLKGAIAESIRHWQEAGPDKWEHIRKKLLESSWFRDANGGPPRRPDEVFLYEDRPRQVRSFAQEKFLKAHDPIYEALEIRKIQETRNPTKLIRQLERLGHEDPNSNHVHDLVETYRMLMYQISRLWGQSNEIRETIDAMKLRIPILRLRPDGGGNEFGLPACFAGTDQRRHRLHLPHKPWIHLPHDTSKQFVTSLGVEIFDPQLKLIYRDEKGAETQPSIDKDFQSRFQEKPYLPSLFAIAEAHLQTAFDKEEAIKRWQRLQIRTAPELSLEFASEGGASPSITRARVIHVPPKGGEKIAVLAHSASNPFEDPLFSDFGPAIAEGVFGNLSLASAFTEYLAACQREVPGMNLAEHSLARHGIGAGEVARMEAFVHARLLTPAEMAEWIGILKQVTGLVELNEENWREADRFRVLEIAFGELENSLHGHVRLQALLADLDPRPRNRHLLAELLPELQLRLEFCNRPIPRDANGDAIFHPVSIDRFDFCREMLFAEYEVVDMDPDELENFRIRRDHDLLDLPSRAPSLPGISGIQINHQDRIVTVEVFDNARKTETEAAQRKRGEGAEIILCREAAGTFLRDSPDRLQDLIECLIATTLQQQIHGSRIGAYLEKLEAWRQAESKPGLAELASALHVAKAIGDGLGYDLYYPELSAGELSLLKVELKSARGTSEVRIHLTENERRCILRFDENGEQNWRLWLNDKSRDITQPLISAIKRHAELLKQWNPVEVHADSWFLLIHETAQTNGHALGPATQSESA